MTIYHVQVGTHNFQVDITGNQCFINGIQQQARLIQLNANNLFLLCWEQKNRVLHLQPQDGQTYAVTTQGRRVIALVGTGTGERPQSGSEDACPASRLLAPMPGLVITVHVHEGEQVEKGQVLVTQESMKMQMELRAPVAGLVKKVSACPHQRVEKGAVLVDIQPEGSG
jgi:biotin carboxyl carrier protein